MMIILKNSKAGFVLMRVSYAYLHSALLDSFLTGLAS